MQSILSSVTSLLASSFSLPQILREEFRGYNRQTFRQDLLAGITVAAVALPLALAFGVASGASAAAGLVTAVLAGLVIRQGILNARMLRAQGGTTRVPTAKSNGNGVVRMERIENNEMPDEQRVATIERRRERRRNAAAARRRRAGKA